MMTLQEISQNNRTVRGDRSQRFHSDEMKDWTYNEIFAYWGYRVLNLKGKFTLNMMGESSPAYITDMISYDYNRQCWGLDPLFFFQGGEILIEEEELPAPTFLVRIGFAESTSRARQLLKDGIVSIGGNSVRDGVFLSDPKYVVYIYDGLVVRLGKKNIRKFSVINHVKTH